MIWGRREDREARVVRNYGRNWKMAPARRRVQGIEPVVQAVTRLTYGA